MLTLGVDEAVLTSVAMHKLSRPKVRAVSVLQYFIQTMRPVVEEEEPSLDVEDDLISFKTYDDSQFPTWVTEELRLGDLTAITRSDVSRMSPSRTKTSLLTVADSQPLGPIGKGQTWQVTNPRCRKTGLPD